MLADSRPPDSDTSRFVKTRHWFYDYSKPQPAQHYGKKRSKSQTAAAITDKAGITEKTAGEILDHVAELAYMNAKNRFTLPGLGKLVLVNRKARMGRNPATGVEVKIPAIRRSGPVPDLSDFTPLSRYS